MKKLLYGSLVLCALLSSPSHSASVATDPDHAASPVTRRAYVEVTDAMDTLRRAINAGTHYQGNRDFQEIILGISYDYTYLEDVPDLSPLYQNCFDSIEMHITNNAYLPLPEDRRWQIARGLHCFLADQADMVSPYWKEHRAAWNVLRAVQTTPLEPCVCIPDNYNLRFVDKETGAETKITITTVHEPDLPALNAAYPSIERGLTLRQNFPHHFPKSMISETIFAFLSGSKDTPLPNIGATVSNEFYDMLEVYSGLPLPQSYQPRNPASYPSVPQPQHINVDVIDDDAVAEPQTLNPVVAVMTPPEPVRMAAAKKPAAMKLAAAEKPGTLSSLPPFNEEGDDLLFLWATTAMNVRGEISGLKRTDQNNVRLQAMLGGDRNMDRPKTRKLSKLAAFQDQYPHPRERKNELLNCMDITVGSRTDKAAPFYQNVQGALEMLGQGGNPKGTLEHSFNAALAHESFRSIGEEIMSIGGITYPFLNPFKEDMANRVKRYMDQLTDVQPLPDYEKPLSSDDASTFRTWINQTNIDKSGKIEALEALNALRSFFRTRPADWGQSSYKKLIVELSAVKQFDDWISTHKDLSRTLSDGRDSWIFQILETLSSQYEGGSLKCGTGASGRAFLLNFKTFQFIQENSSGQ